MPEPTTPAKRTRSRAAGRTATSPRGTKRGAAPKKAAPAAERDWTDQAVDTIEQVVLAVKEKTTIPLTTAARALVYGVVMAVLGVVIAVLLAIAFVRVLTVYDPIGTIHGQHRVWVPDLVIGIVFTLAGLWVWSLRASKETK